MIVGANLGNRETLFKLTENIQKEVVALKLFTDISRCHPQMLEPFDWLHWKLLPSLNDEIRLNLLHPSFQFLDYPELNYALSRDKKLANMRNLLQNWDKTYRAGNRPIIKSEVISIKRVSASEEELLKDLRARAQDEIELQNFSTLLNVAKNQNFSIANSEILRILSDLAEKRLALNIKFDAQNRNASPKNVGQWTRLETICDFILLVDPKHQRALDLIKEARQRNK